MLSLFMSITGGVSWEQLLVPLHAVSPFWVFVFLFYVSFTIFAMPGLLWRCWDVKLSILARLQMIFLLKIACGSMMFGCSGMFRPTRSTRSAGGFATSGTVSVIFLASCRVASRVVFHHLASQVLNESWRSNWDVGRIRKSVSLWHANNWQKVRPHSSGKSETNRSFSVGMFHVR